MNILLKNLHSYRAFSVISAEDDVIRGGRFIRKGKIWTLVDFVEDKIDPENPALSWRKVAKVAVLSELRIVTGKIDEAFFFRFQSSELSGNAQRGAVEFELPRHLSKSTENWRTQFCVSGKVSNELNGVWVNVAAYPEHAIEKFMVRMRRAGIVADEFIHPMMAVTDEADAVMLPELDADFAYINNSWMPMPGDDEVSANRKEWLQKIARNIALPESFNADDYMLMLLAAEIVISGKINKSSNGFRILPEIVRPVRYRSHLITSGLLIVALIASLIWRFMITYGNDISEYRRLTSETKKMQQRNKELKSSMKRSSKELKEMTRIVETTVGEPDAIAEFAMFSSTLPQEVLVSSIRWNESDIDVTVQCEDSNMDFDRVFKPLKYWKVSQQGRQNQNQSVATITLKLTSFEESKTK